MKQSNIAALAGERKECDYVKVKAYYKVLKALVVAEETTEDDLLNAYHFTIMCFQRTLTFVY